MSKTSRNFEQVSQHFRCPIHLGKLKEPRRLPCEHTLCKDCLKGLIKSSLKKENNKGVFECPECRAKHHIPTTETENWADWFPVDAFCVIQIKTLERFQDSQLCEIHEDKFKEYFCFHHRELYCPDCIIDKHTTSPCYSRNSKDAVTEVRKHINDLVGQLRMQDEQATRVRDSKVAAAHTDDLLQKVWEVDHMLDKFHKTMKKKLQDAKTQIENATKLLPADKDHLKTIHSLILQTKRLVEDKLRSANTKTQDGQNDILRLWKPLDGEVKHFGSVLQAVEKRPFCVNVQVDDAFMDLISLNHEPLVVINDSMQWTPLNPVPERSPSARTVKSSRRALSFREPSKRSSDKDSFTLNLSPRSSRDTATFPRSRSSYRTVIVNQGGNQMVQLSPITPHKDTKDTLTSHQQRIQERNPTILPKLTAGNLTSGDTSKVFNIRAMKLRGISMQSIFEFPCEDILSLDNNIITITERAVQKFSLRYQFLQSMALRAPLKLCYMRDDSHNVLVLDNSCGLSLIATAPRLQLLYKIETDRAYTGVCHMRTTMTEDPYGRCLYHMHLALTHVWNREDCIDVMVVTYEKNTYTFGLVEEITITPSKVKTICWSNDDQVLKNINHMCTAPDPRKLLIGTEAGVVCLSRNGDIIWSYLTNKPVASIDSKRALVFVAIEKESRVMILDQHGNVLVDNIFPSASTMSRPSRVSIGKAAMLVREFIDHDQTGLKSMVHVFTLSFI